MPYCAMGSCKRIHASSGPLVFTVTGSGVGQIGHPEKVTDTYLVATFTSDDLGRYQVLTIQLTVHVTEGGRRLVGRFYAQASSLFQDSL